MLLFLSLLHGALALIVLSKKEYGSPESVCGKDIGLKQLIFNANEHSRSVAGLFHRANTDTAWIGVREKDVAKVQGFLHMTTMVTRKEDGMMTFQLTLDEQACGQCQGPSNRLVLCQIEDFDTFFDSFLTDEFYS